LRSTVFHQSVHLEDHEMYGLSTECPFCASSARKPVMILQTSPEVFLLNCASCHASSASRMPKPEALDSYYGQYYDDSVKEKVTADTPSRIAAHIFDHSKTYIADPAGKEVAMLDYGGGDGSISTGIANRMLANGVQKVSISLLDYDQSLKECEEGQIQIIRPANLAEVPDGAMDIVVASAVIEHIPDPRKVLIKLLASLKVGGVFYARTPYVYPLMKIAQVINSQFDFTYPAHVHDLGAKFWNGMIENLSIEGEFEMTRSTPSIVETSFDQHFVRTLAAYTLKIPGYVFKENYGLVGGWEVFIRRLA